MTSPSPTTDNPFSSQRLRPGAIEFLFDEGQSLEQCLAILERTGGWGQIRGSHGSGKSTLLAAIVEHWRAAGRRVQQFTLHDGQRRLPAKEGGIPSCDEGTLVAIDGFEQLSLVNRWRVKRACRRRGCGLLITTHGDLGLPDVFVTQPTLEAARRAAARLLQGWPVLVSPADVERCYAANGGDVRETLFALYDVYEARRPRQS